jgi:hypothetical protein
MPYPSHPQLDHSNYIWRRVQVMKLLITITVFSRIPRAHFSEKIHAKKWGTWLIHIKVKSATYLSLLALHSGASQRVEAHSSVSFRIHTRQMLLVRVQFISVHS